MRTIPTFSSYVNECDRGTLGAFDDNAATLCDGSNVSTLADIGGGSTPGSARNTRRIGPTAGATSRAIYRARARAFASHEALPRRLFRVARSVSTFPACAERGSAPGYTGSLRARTGGFAGRAECGARGCAQARHARFTVSIGRTDPPPSFSSRKALLGGTILPVADRPRRRRAGIRARSALARVTTTARKARAPAA